MAATPSKNLSISDATASRLLGWLSILASCSLLGYTSWQAINALTATAAPSAEVVEPQVKVTPAVPELITNTVHQRQGEEITPVVGDSSRTNPFAQ